MRLLLELLEVVKLLSGSRDFLGGRGWELGQVGHNFVMSRRQPGAAMVEGDVG